MKEQNIYKTVYIVLGIILIIAIGKVVWSEVETRNSELQAKTIEQKRITDSIKNAVDKARNEAIMTEK